MYNGVCRESVTNGKLSTGDPHWTKSNAPVVRWRFNAEEHDVTDEVAEYEGQTADKALSAREVTAARSTTDREPDVPVTDTTVTEHNQLEPKASSHEGQCIPAGSSVSPPRMVLITMSIITMRSISRKLCFRLITLCKISTAIMRI